MSRLIVALVCLAVAGFCAVGFLATSEPGAPNALAFRIGYGAVGVGCLVAVVRLLFLGNKGDS